MGRTGAIKCKSSCHKVASELFATNARETHHGTLNSCFVSFHNVWVHLGPFFYCTKLDAIGPIYYNYWKSSCQEVALELVTTIPPDPYNCSLNSCFSVFRNVYVHLGPFRYCTKLDAKWAELVQLMQKFMPRSHV